MIKKIRPALLSLCLIGLGAAPALADYQEPARSYGWRPHYHYYAPPVYAPEPAPRVAFAPTVLPEHVVRRHLRQQGFHNIDHLHFDGRHYRARANDQWDRRVLIVASAHTGYVIQVRPLVW